MKLLLGVLIISIAALAQADVVEVQKCTAGPLPSSVDVAGCKATPCDLPKGQDASVLVDFTATQQLTSLKPQVRASLPGGLTVPFVLPVDRQNACDWLVGGQCPVSRDEDVTYELRLPVLASYPSLSLTVELQLLDQSGAVVVCFQVPANVV
ncbi:AGAP002851-PA-like protein [Anopheles sinensis]|uniref:AGAP002851-PA-like protein n=1 Tax=Anopheles sinensis TaxID=74873 RepID=A0A084VK08_ANOSI|nr:AGAP002851-PA-like protein [Anopheles sinensis]